MQTNLELSQNSSKDFSNLYQESDLNCQSKVDYTNQRQQDLQLLIRATEKIRALEEENCRLSNQKQSAEMELFEQRLKSKILSEENRKLRTQIDELSLRIQKFTAQLNCQYHLVTEESEEKETNQKISQKQRKQSTDVEPNSYQIIPTKEPTKRTVKQSQKTLKLSESSPVILNINVNTISKEQRQQFLSSCKEQFAHQLQKINQKSSSTKNLNRNMSDYFESNYQSRITSQNKNGGNMFLKQAQKEFETQVSKTLKNNCYVDTKKRSSSGSLIRRNSSQNVLNKELLGDRTNYVNSKYASVNQIMAFNASKSSNLTKNSSHHLRLGSTHDYSSSQKVNGQISRNIYCSKDKRTSLMDRKNKEFDMQLRNQNKNGFIKYRGLCL